MAERQYLTQLGKPAPNKAFNGLKALTRLYEVSESSVNWAMNGRYPVRGAVLLAVASWMLGIREPVNRSTRLNGRKFLTRGRGRA